MQTFPSTWIGCDQELDRLMDRLDDPRNTPEQLATLRRRFVALTEHMQTTWPEEYKF